MTKFIPPASASHIEIQALFREARWNVAAQKAFDHVLGLIVDAILSMPEGWTYIRLEDFITGMSIDGIPMDAFWYGDRERIGDKQYGDWTKRTWNHRLPPMFDVLSSMLFARGWYLYETTTNKTFDIKIFISKEYPKEYIYKQLWHGHDRVIETL
jgi:hypothetical protein